MGSNFVVTAFVPSMGFIIFSLFAFQPVIPKSISQRIGIVAFSNINFTELGAFTLIAFLLTLILGFTLFALGTFIYKSFEGYVFLLGANTSLRRKLLQRQKRRAQKMLSDRARIESEIQKLEKKLDLNKPGFSTGSLWQKRRYQRQHERWQLLRDQKYGLIASYQNNFPPPQYVLPTRFGNILRAAEVYPSRRYGIDAVPTWGRLAHIMSESGMEKVDQANNQCLFLLNCCLLSVAFATVSFLVSAYQAFTAISAREGVKELLYFIPIDPSIVHVYQQRVVIYLVLGIIAFFIARMFYEASLVNVGQYGSMIRSSFDLYRFDLLSALHFPLPKDLDEEIDRWRAISRFLVSGTDLGTPEFIYEHPPKQKEKP